MATSSRRPEALQRSQKYSGYQRRAPHEQEERRQKQTDNSGIINAGLNANIVATKHATSHVITTQIRTRNSQNILQQPSPPRMKRPLDPIVNNYDPSKTKRTRITVEIVSRPAPPAGPLKSITVKPQQLPTNESSVASTNSPPSPPLSVPPTRQKPSKTATAAESSIKKHKEKEINGIKHELDRLQPNAADTNSATEPSGRKLRSQEATRFKSELSAYFPDYDEVIGNDPKEQRTLSYHHINLI